MARKKSKKISVNTSGKRKTAVARATVRKGQGRESESMASLSTSWALV